MAKSEVTSSPPPPKPPAEGRRAARGSQRRIPGFVLFGIVAATIEMGIVLALLYC